MEILPKQQTLQEQFETEFLGEGQVIDAYMVYQILRRLVTPFIKTKAYELGIIDGDGNNLKSRNELETPEEKAAYTLLDILVFNLKKILQKVPFGKTRIASYAAALFLVREHENRAYAYDTILLEKKFLEFHTSVTSDPLKIFLMDNGIRNLTESVPVNNISSGAIAGPVYPLAKKLKKNDPKEDEEFEEKILKRQQTYLEFLKDLEERK